MSDAADSPRPRFSVNPVAIIVVCAVGLTILGLTSLFSASAYFKEGPYFYLGKQLVGVVLAVGLGWIASRVNLDYLRRYVWIIGGVTILLLVAVLVPHLGVSVKGSRRWLGYGPLRLQVSEFAKLAMVFCLAHHVAINQTKIDEIKRGYIYPLAIIGLFAALVLKEPDFGTAALLLIVGLTLLFLAGAKWRFIVPTLFLALVVLGVALAHNANRLERFVAFLDVEGNKQGGTYQLYQSEAAFAAGGRDGVGLGNGRQQHNFLPEANNDFIAAVIGEELGLWATLGVVLLFSTIFVAGLVHLRRAPNLFQFLLATGCLLLICLQAIVNLGVVTGLFPTKGMSLPFISAGLSNLLLMGLLLGILANTQRRWSRPALTVAGGEFNEALRVSKKIIITCGGTGGHLAPGIALAEGLTARGHTVILFISQKRVDARLVEKYPHFSFVPVPGTAFSWHPLGFVRFISSQVRGFVFSLRAMRQMRPDVMVGFGGFTSVSAVIAGRTLRIPVALHEANRVPGRTVCLLGRLVQRVYLPQGVRLSSVRASATRHVNLPVRREISRQPRAAARERLTLDPTQRVLVVFGGSQGAAALNDWARSQLDRLAHAGVQVYCITGLGKGRHEVLQLSTQTYAPIRAVFTPFSDDVADLLSAADLVVARAGAGTIAELIRCTTPAILVPYPYAASDHQRANAAFFEKQGGGVVVDQMFIPTLHAEVLDVIFNDWLLHKFRDNLARMDHAASFDLLLDDLTGLITHSSAEKKSTANPPSAVQPHAA